MHDTPQTKCSWRRFILPCSLLLNLFLVAVIGGRLLYGRAEGLESSPLLARLQARVEAVLPRQEAQAFKDIIASNEPRFTQARKALAASRADLIGCVTADPFDKAATAQALAAWKAAWDSFAVDFSDTLVNALAQVSPEGRRKLISGRFGRLPKE